jgi:branched-chain amino acid transport system ATP-binding protein
VSGFLEVTKLEVSYGNVQALRGIDFYVDRGEIVSLIGANGAGKTSCLMAISNLIAGKKKGSLKFRGQDISATESSAIVWQGISHIPEGRHIFPRLTVEENLLMGSFGSRRFSRRELAKNIDEIYTMFPRLRERRKQTGGTLSGGEQQMLAIGRGLVFAPALLMLDEPSLGLAPLIVKEIFEMLLDIRDRGTTVLLIEQNAGMALQIADRGYVLENGRISLTGSGEDLLENEMVLKAYLGM